MRTCDALVVGGGMAGLTSAAYLAKYGCDVVLCEKRDVLGGLVHAFRRDGYVFDAGIRAIENSGMVFPMLRDLGIELDFVENDVSFQMAGERAILSGADALSGYAQLLRRVFPEDGAGVDTLIRHMRRAMRHMDVLYGRDNPLFDGFDELKKDPQAALKLLPWAMRLLWSIGRIDALSMPVYDYLARDIDNPALIDMFAQHFFTGTPAFFALSYFSLYMDYRYPLGGTGVIAEAMGAAIERAGGTVLSGAGIDRVDAGAKVIYDENGHAMHYKKLIWAADMRALYDVLDEAGLDAKARGRIAEKRAAVRGKAGSESVLTVYLCLDADVGTLRPHMGAHVFYTPSARGMSCAALATARDKAFSGAEITGDEDAFFAWLGQILAMNTFEVSCPCMRDESLAPKGKTGLIVSCLMDYAVIRQVRERGWYDRFKAFCEAEIVRLLAEGMPWIAEDAVEDRFSATPLTMERMVGTTGGSLSGWGFDGRPMPVPTKMAHIASAIKTPVPDVYQAGQWTFAPGGLPIAVLTGKLAADRVRREVGAR